MSALYSNSSSSLSLRTEDSMHSAIKLLHQVKLKRSTATANFVMLEECLERSMKVAADDGSHMFPRATNRLQRHLRLM